MKTKSLRVLGGVTAIALVAALSACSSSTTRLTAPAVADTQNLSSTPPVTTSAPTAAPATTTTPATTEAPTPAASTKPVATTKPVVTTKPAVTAKPVASTKPAAPSFPEKPAFDVDYPWAETAPSSLALPWTSIAPSMTSPTVALVALDPHTVLIVTNRANIRTATTISGIESFKLVNLANGGYGVNVTCASGEVIPVAYLPGKTWTSTEHPGVVRFRPVTDGGNACAG